MFLQIVGVILAGIGFFGSIPILFFIGGFICLATDIMGFMSGKLKPIFPVILYVLGYYYVGDWRGVLLGSAVGNLIDVIPVLLFSPSSLFSDEEKEQNKLNNLDKRINERAEKEKQDN